MTASPAATSNPRQPEGIKALGYANLALGGVGLLVGGYVLGMGIDMMHRATQDAQSGAAAGCGCLVSLATVGKHLSTLMIVYGVVLLVVHALMIAAGVGLLRLAPWGRTLSLTVAILFIAAGGGVLGVVYSVPVIMLLMKPEWKAAFAAPPGQAATTEPTDMLPPDDPPQGVS